MNISETIFKESDMILKSFAMGGILMFLYDILRIFRKLFPHSVVFVAVEDVLFWLFSGVTIFILLFLENDGSLRGFFIFGIVVGMMVYLGTISPYFVKFTVFLLKKLWYVLSFPLRFLIKLLKKPLQNFWKTVKIALSRGQFGK